MKPRSDLSRQYHLDNTSCDSGWQLLGKYYRLYEKGRFGTDTMHSSRIVIKTERQSKPLEFGEVRLTVNPQKSSSDFLVTPGREGTVTTYGRSTSREDSSQALPVNPEIKGQPSWVKSDNTRPLRPIQHGAGNTCSAVNKYTCQPTVTSQQSWKNKSNGQEPYKTSNYGLPPSKSFGTEHTTTYRNVPAHSSQFSNVGNTKSHTNAYSTPVSSVPKYHDGTRSYSPTGHGTRSAERTGSRLDLDPKLTQQNNHSRSPWQRPKVGKTQHCKLNCKCLFPPFYLLPTTEWPNLRMGCPRSKPLHNA